MSTVGKYVIRSVNVNYRQIRSSDLSNIESLKFPRVVKTLMSEVNLKNPHSYPQMLGLLIRERFRAVLCCPWACWDRGCL